MAIRVSICAAAAGIESPVVVEIYELHLVVLMGALCGIRCALRRSSFCWTTRALAVLGSVRAGTLLLTEDGA